MKPYYEHGGITIFHGDCREWVGIPGCVIADPPYGIGLDTRARWSWLEDFAPIAGDDEPFDPSWILSLRVPTVLWGANHYASKLPDAKGWLAWDKATRNGLDLKQAEIELAWTNCVSRPKAFRHMWSGAFKASERGERYHPTQKPVALMAWCLGLVVGNGGVVLDPYMGSGPTLVAAKMSSRRAIGIELDEHYCEIAAKRLEQEVLPLEVSA